MLYDLGMAASSINTFAIDDVVAEGDIISDTLNGTVPIYVNDEIHKEIEQIMKMENNFHKSIERKYIKLEDKLSDIIEPETFNFVSKEDPSMYKEQREFDEMFVKEKEKIDKLDIGAKEKGMLRNILLDTIKYGKSYGTMYETFDNMSEYVEQKKSEVINGKSI